MDLLIEPGLSADLHLGTIAGGKKRLNGKARSFFLLLAAESEVGRHVLRDEVHALPDWRSMAFESVGKQVARLVDTLAAEGYDLVDCQQKTNGWRLKPHVCQALDAETRARAAEALAALDWRRWARFATAPVEEVVPWALGNLDSLLAMTSGQADASYARLRQGFEAARHPDLHAIANVLATRVGQRLERAHLPVPPARHRVCSLFEAAVEHRRHAAYAVRAPSAEWPGLRTELEQSLNEIFARGDLTTLAVLLNACAVLDRRLGEHARALDCIKEALPLAIFSGDLILMQNVLFNFGNILSEIQRSDPAACAGTDPLALLEADMSIRRRFGLGKDSAQAELLVAYLAWERHEVPRAQAALDSAEPIITLSRSHADRALYLRVEGLIFMDSPDPDLRHLGRARLEEAAALFETAGNAPAAAVARAEGLSGGRSAQPAA